MQYLTEESLRSAQQGAIDRNAGKRTWAARHEVAFREPSTVDECAIVYAIRAIEYAILASEKLGYAAGDDGYFGEHFEAQIDAALARLNFDCGRLDCGTLDRLIRALAKRGGVDRS